MPTIPELYSSLKSKKGFTLIELLVVISIIAILITLVTATLTTAQAKARDSQRKTDLDALQKAMEIYKSDTKGAAKYPSNIYAEIGTSGLLTLEYGKYIKDTPTDPSIVDAGADLDYFYVPYKSDITSTCTSGANEVRDISSCQNYILVACLENNNDSNADSSTDSRCTTISSDLGSYTLNAP